MAERPTPDQLAEKVRGVMPSNLGPGDDLTRIAAAYRRLDDLLALAKQGEAYDAHLAHLESLYRGEPEEPSTEELAETVREGLVDGNEWSCGCNDPGNPSRCIHVERFDALSELVKRAQGHVPVESLAACMTELDEAQAELRGVHTALAEADVPRSAGVDEPLWSDQHRVRLLRADRDRLAAALEQAERERDAHETELHSIRWAVEGVAKAEKERDEALADRDRLAAALEWIVSEHGSVDEGVLSVAREALGSAQTTQEPA